MKIATKGQMHEIIFICPVGSRRGAEVTDHLHRHPVHYQCFKNLQPDGSHQYNYSLSMGISHERSGMYLLERENVLTLIRKAH